ncbi:hypothetical protein PUR57_35170 [Streptomyces sp. JV176]|uniref:hypothetical protein n=1 Tax=Streptomyces sp. JV176 TaxID=858630 RepID=UPI002E7898B9|nr:hypothetical protein [Streptomyces sp. JV176]MEE1803853.1 hypothetical protein [Streptomyces sp. JV176]
MLIGGAEIYLNHPVIRVGSGELQENLTPLGGSPFIASEGHIRIAARAQVGLVRVRVWNEAGPIEGVVVFDGPLLLSDGSVYIGDVLGVSRYQQRVGDPGDQRLMVSVDDPGKASRINIVVNPGKQEVTLTNSQSHPLPSFLVTEASTLESTDKLGLILSAHDIPLNRLAAAVELIHLASREDGPTRRVPMVEFRIRMVSEWLRWISPSLSTEKASSISSFISEHLQGILSDDIDSASVAISSEVLRRATT